MPGSQRSQSREPAMLWTTPIPPRTPTGTSNLESPPPSPRSAGGLTFHPPYIHNTAGVGTSHRVSSCQLCMRWSNRLIKQLRSRDYLGQRDIWVLVLLTFYCFLFSPSFISKMKLFCDEQWSCFVFYLFDFCYDEKKRFLLLLKYISI